MSAISRSVNVLTVASAVWYRAYIAYKHLRETADNDAPYLIDYLFPLLLYADDLILISTSAAGLQRQLDALQGFCEQRQLTVNLTKTKY